MTENEKNEILQRLKEMKDLEEKKNEDLKNIRKKIDELVGYAWERGYKSGQDERMEPVEEEHDFCIGDVVTTYSSLEEIILGLTIDVNRKPWASVYSRDFDVPQMLPLSDLKFTGKHVNILEFFNKALTDISGGEEK